MIELLVVLAIILVLAGVLFPVFVSMKSIANQAVCTSNFHQISLAMEMYEQDYDDKFPLVNWHPDAQGDPNFDRTWVQLLLPYTHSLGIFEDPADNSRRFNESESFDQNLIPSDTYARYYKTSLRSNVGYNYLYLSPVVKVDGEWTTQSKVTDQISNPGKTMVFVDSVFARDKSGSPYGGGSYVVVPPCRFELVGGQKKDTFLGDIGRHTLLTPQNGWEDEPESKWVYGSAWPWHSGRMNVARVDGSVKSMHPTSLTRGCDARPSWTGFISDPSEYIWDSN